jgi:hypothetical protein
MKWIAAAIFLLSTGAAPAATLCQDAPGSKGVHWSWRDIDGKRCWFKRVGPIPPKAELRWAKPKAREQQVTTEVVAVPIEQRTPSIRMLTTRIRWEGISDVEANWIDGDAPVHLMHPESLSGPAGVGGNWVVPSRPEDTNEARSFAARFAPVIESRKPRVAVP